MANFEPVNHSPNFDIFWQQWLARQAAFLTLDSAQELSNKTFDLSVNTLSGTIAEFNAALSDGDFVTLAGAETLTGPKTLTSPIINTGDINTPDIDGGTIDNTVIGATTPAAITGSSITVSNTADAAFILTDTNAGTNIKSFRWNQNGGQLSLQGLNDAGAVNLTAMTFVRTAATTVDITITANNGDITLSPTLDLNINVPRDILINQTGAGSVDNLNADIVNIAIDGNNSFTVNGDEVFTEGDAELAAIAGLTSAADRLPYFTGSGTAALATFTAGGRALVNSAGTADTFPYFSASNTVTLASITAAGLALLDDADNTAQRTTLGLGTIATQDANNVNIDGGTIDDITLDGVIAGTPSFSGVITVTSTGLVFNGADAGAAQVGIEFGKRGTANTPFLDFHSGATDVDYDARIIASGGTGSNGGGTLTFTLGTLALGTSTISGSPSFTGSPTASGSWTWTTASAGVSPIRIKSTEAGAGSGPLLDLDRDSASPAASDLLALIRFRGKDDGAGDNDYASIRATILDPAAGSEDGDLRLGTIVAGTSTTRMTIANGMYMAGATGGDQGAGTINATAVYDDGVILTDYVPDAYLDSDYSVTDYDNRIPPRVLEDGTIVRRMHGPARRFKTNFDELDPVLFANKWKASRKLPAFNRGPEKKSTGECIQALLETCEILAVHIDKHETRIQSLEA